MCTTRGGTSHDTSSHCAPQQSCHPASTQRRSSKPGSPRTGRFSPSATASSLNSLHLQPAAMTCSHSFGVGRLPADDEDGAQGLLPSRCRPPRSCHSQQPPPPHHSALCPCPQPLQPCTTCHILRSAPPTLMSQQLSRAAALLPATRPPLPVLYLLPAACPPHDAVHPPAHSVMPLPPQYGTVRCSC